jgi:RNA polymerase-binding transcription factor DksA
VTASGQEREPSPALVAQRLAGERALALDQLARLDADLRSLIDSSQDSNADDEHDPEGHTIAYERSQLSALAEHGRAHLAAIEAATARLADGTYWFCEVCGEPIGEGRLEARPSTRTCVRHATAAGSRGIRRRRT